jgi:hypothetical protein
MKIIEPGHIYDLEWLDQPPVPLANRLVFVNRELGTEHGGTQTQEVLRTLIDRTQHCDRCLRWEGNDRIIKHLRMALALHEARALERKTEKGLLHPEKVEIDGDGHFRTPYRR